MLDDSEKLLKHGWLQVLSQFFKMQVRGAVTLKSAALSLKKPTRIRSHELVPIVSRDVVGRAVQGRRCPCCKAVLSPGPLNFIFGFSCGIIFGLGFRI